MTKLSPKNRVFKYSLLIITLFMIFVAFNKNSDYNNLKEVLIKDKQDLQAELTTIVDDYKKLNIKNKKLSKKVITEINKIISLKKAVNDLEIENFDLIRSFRKKTARLQEDNRMLISKVDSLNNINSNLKKENLLAKKTLDKKSFITKKLQKNNNKLAKVNKELETQIAPARKIKTSDVKAIALKERSSGKLSATTKHNRTDVIQINFKLLENELTPAGDKKILIQLKDNNNNVIAAKRNSSTLKDATKIKYSDELVADYKNKEIDVLSLILVDRDNMEKGEYKINVFIDGDFSSSSVVTLR